MYGSLEDASAYFNQKLRTYAWDNASDADRTKALWEATRAIDRLAFKGAKTEVDQENQFPRCAEEEVPDVIEWATYELALALLDAIDPEAEIRNLGVTGESYASVRTTYDRSLRDQGVLSGIPSSTAWQFLQPYLADPDSITVSRVS
jgi:hypothetical protein